MSIFVIGINHKTASLALREKAYFASDKLSLYLQDILQQSLVREAVLLSTCNRSELYCEAEDIQVVSQWFFNQTLLSPHEFENTVYLYRDRSALAHIMQVAAGLDSMVLGESQILGQMKEAFSESCSVGAVNTLFHRLFQQVFSVAKEIRTTTAIGACPVSVASASIQFAKQKFFEFKQAKVVLIGAGETATLLMRYLHSHLLNPVILVNRDLEKAKILTEKLGGAALPFHELAQALCEADIVFSATGSALPIVNKTLMQEVMQVRNHQPLILIDVAVPRDIEASVGELPHVSLYCIDDLKTIIEENRQGREHAAEKAREMIQEKSIAFMESVTSFDKVTHMIRAYRNQIEALCFAELIKAKQQLHQGLDPLHVLDTFAHAFTKKLLHTPSVQLRNASEEERFQLLKVAKQLFALPDSEILS